MLRSVLEDPAQTPLSPYYRQAMFELGELYYNSKKYDLTIDKLTEAIDRYPDDPKLGKYMFLVGDSYRKSGLSLDDRLAVLSQDPTATVSRDKAFQRRHGYLERARDYFGKATDFYFDIPEGRRSRLDKLYLRHCSIYRADCMFELGYYRKALEQYEKVALRYQLTPTALTAFLQIINCHIKLDNPRDAGSASRRAVLQLANMSEDVLTSSPVKVTREEWQEWFNWTERSGLW